MEASTGTVDLKPRETPYGKVIGVATGDDQLRLITEAIAKLGLRNIEVLEGGEGSKVIEGWQESVAETFLGDMESELVRRFLKAVNHGLIVFAVSIVEHGTAQPVAEAAKAQGASEVVDFGTMVITNY